MVIAIVTQCGNLGGMTSENFYAVVPAGGAGTRLWPLSRAGAPKFLHDLTGAGRTLIQATWDRLEPLATSARILVVTGQKHQDAVTAQLPDVKREHVLAEPSPRDSMAAIGLAAAVIAQENPDAIMGSFAADHNITDDAAFHQTIREAIAVAATGELVTIGITPTWPATGFGYIKAGQPLDLADAPHAVRVTEFVEKPNSETAQEYLDTGNYSWNAGMFVVKVSVLLELLKTHQPTLHDGLVAIAQAWGTPAQQSVLDEVWPRLTRISIDHAIAEPVAALGQVAVVASEFGWDDVGDWKSLAEILPASHGGSDKLQVLGDAQQVLSKDATGLVVPTGNRMVAVMGLTDVVVVDTPDAVLVTSRDQAQSVKAIVERLKEAGRTELT